MDRTIVEVRIERDRDVSLAAQRARLLASLAGLPSGRRNSFGRAVSEIARNALVHASGGEVELRVGEGHGQRGPPCVVGDDLGTPQERLGEVPANARRCGALWPRGIAILRFVAYERPLQLVEIGGRC